MKLKRRDFLNTSLMTASSVMGVSVLGIPSWAQAAAVSQAAGRKKLIVIFLRGAADMLSLFPPRVSNPDLHPLLQYRGSTEEMKKAFLFNARVGTAMNKAALDLGNYPFLFNPEFETSKSIFQGQDVAIVLNTGSKNDTRSHFEQQDIMESGSRVSKTSTGYLGRAAHYLALGSRASIALGATSPYSMRGFDAALIKQVSDLRSKYTIGNPAKPMVDGNDISREERLALFAYSATCADGPSRNICDVVKSAKVSYNQLETETAGTFDMGDLFVHQCELAAKLAKSSYNPPIMTIDLGGWDSHFTQKPLDSSTSFSQNVKRLGAGLLKLKQSLGSEWNNTVVAVMSEFGRTVVANESMGTDHGRGSAMILMGGPVKRNHNSKTVGGWDLSSFEGTGTNRALKVNIDFREVMAEVLKDHMGVPLNSDVVPIAVDAKVQKVFDDLTSFTKRNLV